MNPTDVHRRLNLLNGQWVLVSPHRLQRPWQGAQESVADAAGPAHDPQCYLCPGNTRAQGGQQNPEYTGTWMFPNDFPALLPDPPEQEPAAQDNTPGQDQTVDPFFVAEQVRGECHVVCFSPDHHRTLADFSLQELGTVIDAWCRHSGELQRRWAWVQVFENKGAAMGCSNPHPHGQIWCTDYLPTEIVREDSCQRSWMKQRKRPLLLELVERELEVGERVVASNADWVALVPWWAAWPYELLLLPRFAVQRLEQLQAEQRQTLAAVLQRIYVAYDNLFQTDFPYSMGWHGAPAADLCAEPEAWQLHAHFYPPLLRSASVRKFMVGFELLAETQRDLTAEQAAARLRAQPDALYRSRARHATSAA